MNEDLQILRLLLKIGRVIYVKITGERRIRRNFIKQYGDRDTFTIIIFYVIGFLLLNSFP